MGAGSGLGITGSVPNGAAGTENDIPASTEIDFGDEYIRGFLFDNVLHSEGNGDIHFGLYIPESYDGSEPYALYVTLPGYEGLYFQGVGVNIRAEDYGIEAQKYNERMIIVAPQLNDWKETSARQMDPETSGGRHCGLWHLCLFQTSDRRISFPADSFCVP